MTLADFYSRKGEVLTWGPLQPLWKPEEQKRAQIRGGKLKIDEKQYLEWFDNTRPQLERFCQVSFEDAWANLFWYTNEYLPTIPLIIRTDSGEQVRVPRQLAPLAVNYINYLTNKRVAELSIYKPTHDTIPEDETSNSERMTARVMKKIIESDKRANELPELFNDIEKENMIHGYVYAAIDWDPFSGDRKKKNSIDREGRTRVTLRHAWHVLPWRCREWSKVPCIIEVEDIMHVEEARIKYKDPKIEPHPSPSLYTFQSPFIERIAQDETVIWRTTYKPDMFLPYGAVIRNTHDRVLNMETDVYPWSHEEFPLERYTDIDMTSRFFPMSFYQNVKPLQHTYNNLSGLLKRYIFTLGHPKIIHERGSVNVKALGNAPSLVSVKPSARFQPSIMQVKSIGADPFNFRSTLKDEMALFSDTHKIGLGDLPPNTRSALMISRLREIENQQRGPQIDKRNSFMARVLLKTGSVSADHLPLTSAKNIARVVGKDMVQDVKNLENVKVSSQHRVVIQNSTGFSAEMTGRIAEIGSIENDAKLPLMPEEKRNILGGVLREKHYDVLTAARFTCEAEIEMLNDGVTPPPPRITDDLVTFWNVLSIDMQTMNHRRLPAKIQKAKEDRLMQIEELIEQVLNKNPSGLFAEKVKMLDGYPRVYNLTAQPDPASLQGDQGAGASGGAPGQAGLPPPPPGAPPPAGGPAAAPPPPPPPGPVQ